MSELIENILHEVNKLEEGAYFGKVTGVQGLFIEVSGIRTRLSIGDRCHVTSTNGKIIPCELVSFKEDKLLLMPYASLEGIGLGCRVDVENAKPVIYPHPSWLGRIINAFGEAIDGKGPLIKGDKPYFIKSSPPPAQFRDRVKGKVDLGVKAVNTFLTICKGQRMGIFAGSGVGKSTLMSMMARHTSSDVSVIGLIGERGREAKEFVEDVLGAEGLEKSVLVLATSDESPLMRRQVAEYFRDQNKDVLCMMDSITRFAMAQREISLSVGEPPASKGYTPSVFAELPRLLERAGPGSGNGTITGLLTAMTIMNQLPMPFVPFWTDISSLTAPLPSATVIRQLIFCVPSRVPCPIVTRKRSTPWLPKPANTFPPMRIWLSLFVSVHIKKDPTVKWMRQFFTILKLRHSFLRENRSVLRCLNVISNWSRYCLFRMRRKPETEA